MENSDTIYNGKRKGGRVVDCIGFENRRNFTVTEGSNPSLSVKVKVTGFFHLIPFTMVNGTKSYKEHEKITIVE